MSVTLSLAQQIKPNTANEAPYFSLNTLAWTKQKAEVKWNIAKPNPKKICKLSIHFWGSKTTKGTYVKVKFEREEERKILRHVMYRWSISIIMQHCKSPVVLCIDDFKPWLTWHSW